MSASIIGRCVALAALVFTASAAHAQPLDERLTIVTSFSKDLTAPFAQAFEKRHPGTRVEVQNRNTAAAVAFIRETRSSPPDIFWASAPDAFEVLKKNALLQKYAPNAQGLAAKVGAYPVNDPDGFYVGFAASGYGIMHNTRYLRANNLPVPKEWDDLKKPIYFGHVGISAPSRSGTTHLTVETILQGEGWDKGWASLLEIGGNLAQVSDRSFGVPDAVNSGQYGIGIVIDFFGLSAKASGFPVEFVYPTLTAIVPANVGIIANARNRKTAEAFVEFLLSDEGQQILLDPKIQRLPVRLSTYDKAPAGYPNPFQNSSLGAALAFNVEVSEARYELVNALYDRIITFRLKELNAAWKAIHDAETKLGSGATAEAKRLLAEARKLASAVPISDKEAGDKAIAGSFQEVKPGQKVAGRQAEFEEKWDSFALKSYAEAKALAEKALTAR
ncbi:MAG TPA: extracellular solute-binding protein [Xanthobacteraceae bacterium]|nr:extracellular solute-binding protein [Xanthobacteraceae bacterium]